jgi:uncharacterized membrane protein
MSLIASKTDRLAPSQGPAQRQFLLMLNAVACAGVALFSYRYLLDLGLVPPEIANNAFRRPWLVVHVTFAATALLVGPIQFWPNLRKRVPALHRALGRIYAVGCLAGGIAGLPLALGSTAGPIATAGFGMLAVGWIATTALAWRTALKRDFAAHRAWMIRSFALSLAAVTLRIYLGLVPLLPFSFADAYRAISFLCWVPNVFVAELYLRRAWSHRARRATASVQDVQGARAS